MLCGVTRVTRYVAVLLPVVSNKPRKTFFVAINSISFCFDDSNKRSRICVWLEEMSRALLNRNHKRFLPESWLVDLGGVLEVRKELHHFDETQIQYILITATYLSENLLKIIGLSNSWSKLFSFILTIWILLVCCFILCLRWFTSIRVQPKSTETCRCGFENSNSGFFLFLTALA